MLVPNYVAPLFFVKKQTESSKQKKLTASKRSFSLISQNRAQTKIAFPVLTKEISVVPAKIARSGDKGLSLSSNGGSSDPLSWRNLESFTSFYDIGSFETNLETIAEFYFSFT